MERRRRDPRHWEDRARRAGRVLDLRSPLPLPLPVANSRRRAAEAIHAARTAADRPPRTRRSLVVETPEGSFPLTLDYENAPLAAERFYDMAIAAQFDGQPFSVLPDDYAQVPAKPSSPLLTPEPSPAPFLRGSLGMVRAGRTTDAPEFFIALTPLPGAEGRYTRLPDDCSQATTCSTVYAAGRVSYGFDQTRNRVRVTSRRPA
ncbi:MAG: peptidylprolyl isomerase [Bryobacterales bacterium]